MTAPYCLTKSQIVVKGGQQVAVIQVVPGVNGAPVFLGQPLTDCTTGQIVPVGPTLLTVRPDGLIMGCPVDYPNLGGWQWGKVSGNAFVINGNFAFYLAS